jgi:uncharacterized protein YuzE
MWWIIGALVWLLAMAVIVMFFMGTGELNVGDEVFVEMDDGTFKPGKIIGKEIISSGPILRSDKPDQDGDILDMRHPHNKKIKKRKRN